MWLLTGTSSTVVGVCSNRSSQTLPAPISHIQPRPFHDVTCFIMNEDAQVSSNHERAPDLHPPLAFTTHAHLPPLESERSETVITWRAVNSTKKSRTAIFFFYWFFFAFCSIWLIFGYINDCGRGYLPTQFFFHFGSSLLGFTCEIHAYFLVV